ncbi:MAG: hypothetical protein MHMPM18_001684 [Marteilia pararefringens]
MCTTETAGGGGALQVSVNDNDAGDDTSDKLMHQTAPKNPIAKSAPKPDRNTEDERLNPNKLEPDTAKSSKQLRLRTPDRIRKVKSSENGLCKVYSRSINFKLGGQALNENRAIIKGSDQKIAGQSIAAPESSIKIKKDKNDPDRIRAKLARRKKRQEKMEKNHNTKLVSDGEKSDSSLQKSAAAAERIIKESEAKNNDKLEDLDAPRVKDNPKHVESDKNKKIAMSRKSDDPVNKANSAGEDKEHENTDVKDSTSASKNANVKSKKGKKLRNAEENKKSSEIAQKDPKIPENLESPEFNGANSINRVSVTIETNFKSIEAALQNANNPEGKDIECKDDASIDDVDAAKNDDRALSAAATNAENILKDPEHTQEIANETQPDNLDQIEANKKIKNKKANKSHAEINRSVPEEGDRMKEQGMKHKDLETSSKDAKNKDPKELGNSSKNHGAKKKNKINKAKVLESTSGQCAPQETNVTKNDSDSKSGDSPTTAKPPRTGQLDIPSNESLSRDSNISKDSNTTDPDLDNKTLKNGNAKEASSSTKYARLSRSTSLDKVPQPGKRTADTQCEDPDREDVSIDPQSTGGKAAKSNPTMRARTNTGAVTINSIGIPGGPSAGHLHPSEEAGDKLRSVNAKPRRRDAIVLQPLPKLAESSKGGRKHRKLAIDSKSPPQPVQKSTAEKPKSNDETKGPQLGNSSSRKRYMDDSSLNEGSMTKRATSTNDLNKYNIDAKKTGGKKTALGSRDFDLTEAISAAGESEASENDRQKRRNSRERKNSLIFWRKNINGNKSEKTADIINSNMAVMSPNTLVTPAGCNFGSESGDIPDTSSKSKTEPDVKSYKSNKEDSNNSTGKTKAVSQKKTSIFGRLFANNLTNKKAKGHDLLEAIYGPADGKTVEMIMNGDDILLNASEMRQNKIKQSGVTSPTMSHSFSSDQLDSFLNSGHSLNSKNQSKSQRIKFDTNATMIQILQDKNQISLSKYLKSVDYDVNAPISHKAGKTALHLAVIFGNLSAAVTLLSKGADPNRLDDSMCTPLIYAAGVSGPEMCKVLLTAYFYLFFADCREYPSNSLYCQRNIFKLHTLSSDLTLSQVEFRD